VTKERRIEVFRAGALKRQWAFRFVADNGEKIAQSETYKNKLDAIAGANRIKSGFSKVPVTVEGDR
jgi:uncharacterized protein YegP (UPF0339 family)